MKILIIGGGGREHALAWQCARFGHSVFVAPGNAGTEIEDGISNVAIETGDIDRLVQFAGNKRIDLTIVGPEKPLVAGIVDAFNATGLAIFGPSKAGAQLEGSKAFSKDFMVRHNIPTAFYEVFSEVKPAIEYVKAQGTPIVIKADGLAAGKGVIIANTEQEAEVAITDILSGNRFGNAGSKVVIEEFLYGQEVSFIVISDGKNILPMATSQDHKARDNGDKGPNTGGMGAYSPAVIIDEELHKRVIDEVIKPTIEAMALENMPYVGFLYSGLMINADSEIKVLEYNCRFGDPETQPIMMRLKSDLAELCLLAIKGRLDEASADWDSRCALGVVLAAKGYPSSYKMGEVIKLPINTSLAKVFHAGTSKQGGNIISSGGRVLCATALGVDIADAQKNAYNLAGKINWSGSYYRDDIGFKALKISV